MQSHVENNIPSQLLTDKHLMFFYKYGFVIIKGLHTKEQIKQARDGAESLIYNHKKAIDQGKGEQAFGQLPQGSRSSWSRCEEKRLMKYFDYEANLKMCNSLIGNFQFKHNHPGPGYYTFAPRFYSWSQAPLVAKTDKQERLIQPFDLKKLPNDMSDWSKQFLNKAAQLGISLAPSIDNNWHIDGIDYNTVGVFSILWGSYINSLPKGNMGNLTILPGTHHVIASLLKNKGKFFHYDGKKEKAKPLPQLKREGIADGVFYSIIVDAGDILLAHPWLAHGIGGNFSKEVRLATYCRLSSMDFFTKGRSYMAGKTLIPTVDNLPDPGKWQGNYWANIPALNNWIKHNEQQINAYDGGILKKALNKQ